MRNYSIILLTHLLLIGTLTMGQPATNPVIFADVPDMSMIRVGNNYYMSSTTMHLSPGLPIMQSTDLVNWKLVNYAYDTLERMDALDLTNGANNYGKGSWASSLRYHNGVVYVSTFSQTTGKTYIFSTRNIQEGKWTKVSFAPAYHDHSIFFDGDGKVYMIYGAGQLHLLQLKQDLSGVEPGTDRVLIDNASAPSGINGGLPAEGSQLFKHKGQYYLFNISWPAGGMRTVLIHRASNLNGPWEGRIALQDKGVAQGGLIDQPNGQWFAYLFRDYGAVGRIPYLVPVQWKDGWPVLGKNGKVPQELKLPASKGLIPGIVASDEFTRGKQDRSLPLAWQWNHQPANALWSVTKRPGYLRLKTDRLDTNFLQARNSLTQRTIGPACSGITSIDIAHLKEGDVAGIGLLQQQYGWAGVTVKDTRKYIVMINAESGSIDTAAMIPLEQSTIYLKASCDFNNKTDTAHFYYSLNGQQWQPIGSKLHMTYTLPHFMGYRLALFYYATKLTGGYADFDFFRIRQTTQTKNQFHD